MRRRRSDGKNVTDFVPFEKRREVEIGIKGEVNLARSLKRTVLGNTVN